MSTVTFCFTLRLFDLKLSEMNIIAMRLGPGKHLQGRTLMGGIVKPEEFDYFYEVGSVVEIQGVYT